ncbi:MAG: hypothetical protein C4B59_01255 [Candidatus Methanogaster sp.]|uniref:Uncharacterized protein n=1 Tax=Candidatus Methanogaster sp. TaxID=3386292 RepID=A0AC61L692_9EURY|nr:MAG: hypothetical protein C4B59_01255 [ANME-2 cluster archaeon]
MNNHSHNEPRLDENPETLRSQAPGRVTASADLHFRKGAKTLPNSWVSIPDETKVRHSKRNER